MEATVYLWMTALSLAVLYVLLRERELRQQCITRIDLLIERLRMHVGESDPADDWKKDQPNGDEDD